MHACIWLNSNVSPYLVHCQRPNFRFFSKVFHRITIQSSQFIRLCASYFRAVIQSPHEYQTSSSRARKHRIRTHGFRHPNNLHSLQRRNAAPRGRVAEDETRQGEMKQRYGLTRTMTQARKCAGLTQGDVAKLMCTSRSVVTKWETGALHPNVTTLEKWAEVTGRRLRILMV